MTRYRLWIPAQIIAVLTSLVVWRFAEEDTLRVGWAVLAFIAAYLLIGGWWVFLTGRIRWKALVLGLAGTALLIGLAVITLRYDGSVNGANPLNFTWRWLPETETGLNQLPVVGLVESGEPIEDSQQPNPDVIDFPTFLGPNGDGRVENAGIGENLEAEELWRQRVGIGWSSFAVVGSRAVTQEQRGEQELVTCYELESGELLWSHIDYIRFSEPLGGDGPRATPTITDGVVYAMGGTGILNALTLDRGTVIWSRSVLEEIGADNITWGKANAPLIAGDLVVVTGGQVSKAALEKGELTTPALIAYNRNDGSIAWKAGEGPATYSTPRLVDLAGTTQIVTLTGGSVAAFEPETGKPLWTFPWPSAQPKVAQPIEAGPNRLLVTASYDMKSHLLEITQNNGEWSVEPVWSERQMKTKFSSPVILDGIVFGLDEGKMIAMDLETGERLWKGGRYGFGQNLLVGEEYILVQTERGDVVLVAPTPEEHVELARISPLSSKTWNAPALAGKYLIVRNDREAVCLKLR